MGNRQAVRLLDDGDDLEQLLAAPAGVSSVRDPGVIAGTVVGTIVGFAGDGMTPLITYPAQPDTAALPARATLPLRGHDIGRQVVLTFDAGDPRRPIILGCLLDDRLDMTAPPEQVEIDADGRSLVVTAKERIVLRCGKASITLTKEGKLILQGEYVSNQSAGVLRLKGGSVQIN